MKKNQSEKSLKRELLRNELISFYSDNNFLISTDAFKNLLQIILDESENLDCNAISLFFKKLNSGQLGLVLGQPISVMNALQKFVKDSNKGNNYTIQYKDFPAPSEQEIINMLGSDTIFHEKINEGAIYTRYKNKIKRVFGTDKKYILHNGSKLYI